jgi:hypothetical protein
MDNLIYTDFLLKFERAINKDVFIENQKNYMVLHNGASEVSKKRLIEGKEKNLILVAGKKDSLHVLQNNVHLFH